METPNKYSSANGADRLGFAPISFKRLAGWLDDDHQSAFAAFCSSAPKVIEKPNLGLDSSIDPDDLRECAIRALAAGKLNDAQARCFFEDHFTPYSSGSADQFGGFLTGYFEPELSASLTASAEYSVPLYRPPKELDGLRESNRTLDFDRGSIQSGALSGRNLELVWLKDKTDAYFVHVQGSARLKLQDGQVMRVAFAGKSGHPYTSLGRVLCDRLSIMPSDMTADRLASWMHGNPDEIDALMALNRSYIFFKEVDHLDAEDGPVGAAEVPLIAGRSLAVDQTIHPYGVPIFLSTPEPVVRDDTRLGRLMVAHDTGSAINGSQRGDIFVGSGKSAGLTAGRIQSPARLTILVPSP